MGGSLGSGSIGLLSLVEDLLVLLLGLHERVLEEVGVCRRVSNKFLTTNVKSSTYSQSWRIE
jgi:hypothetical protein